MKTLFTNLKMTCAVAVVALLAGCAGTRTVDQKTAAADLANSNFKAYAQKYMDAKGNPTYDPKSLLDTLEAGKAFNDAGMWEKSQEAFNAASGMMMWKSDTVSTPSGVINLVGSTLTNDTLSPYTGKIYQGGMIDYYRAMNDLMLGRESDARAGFNQVADRQDNAVAQFESFVKASNEATNESFGTAGAETAKKSFADISSKTNDGTKDIPSGLSKVKIRNASADFMAAVFRATSSSKEYDKRADASSGFIKAASSAAATPGGATLVTLLGKSIADGKGEIKNKVIVVYEDGVGPSLSEFRIDLPLFLVTSKVTYTGIALPKFQLGQPAFGGIKLGPKNDATVVMTNMNDLAGLEFDAAYKGVVAKAVISTIVKTAAQFAANSAIDAKAGNSGLGSLLKLGTGAAQAALTKADTRAWINLPNTIQIGFIERPANGTLSIMSADGRPLGQVQITNAPNSLVIVKASGTGGKAAVFTQELPAIKTVPAGI